MSESSNNKTAEIEKLLQAGGMSAVEIARQCGVTRAYVYMIKDKLGKPQAPGRGQGWRPPIPFTTEEHGAFAAALRGPPPVSTKKQKTHKSQPGEQWTEDQARTWFQRQFGRMPQRLQLKAICDELGIAFKVNPNEKSKWSADAYLDDKFRAWMASPEAARIREREQEVAKADAVHVEEAKAKRATRSATQKTRWQKQKNVSVDAGKNAATDAVSLPEAKTSASGYSSRAGDADDVFAAFERMHSADIINDSNIAEFERANEEVLREMKKNAVAMKQIKQEPARAPGKKFGRNEPCPFNPGLKFKRCCGANGRSYCQKQVEGGSAETGVANTPGA